MSKCTSEKISKCEELNGWICNPATGDCVMKKGRKGKKILAKRLKRSKKHLADKPLVVNEPLFVIPDKIYVDLREKIYSLMKCTEFIQMLTPKDIKKIPWKFLSSHIPGKDYVIDLPLRLNPTICGKNKGCLRYYTKCYWTNRGINLVLPSNLTGNEDIVPGFNETMLSIYEENGDSNILPLGKALLDLERENISIYGTDRPHYHKGNFEPSLSLISTDYSKKLKALDASAQHQLFDKRKMLKIVSIFVSEGIKIWTPNVIDTDPNEVNMQYDRQYNLLQDAEYIIFPNTLTYIEGGSFIGWEHLRKIDLSRTKVTVINRNSFDGCLLLEKVALPTGLTSINNGAFRLCKHLEVVDLSKTEVTEIANKVFEDCINLTNVILPETLVSIGPRAFDTCYVLQTVIFPDSLVNIGTEAFNDCLAITTVDLSKTKVTELKPSTFYECESLKYVMLPNSLISIGIGTFLRCISLKSVILPTNLVNIGSGTFLGCISLKSVILPASLVRIGTGTFQGCKALKRIDLSHTNVTVIKESTFEDCISLRSVILPSSLVNIEENAFKGCKALRSVIFVNKLVSISNTSYDMRNGWPLESRSFRYV